MLRNRGFTRISPQAVIARHEAIFVIVVMFHFDRSAAEWRDLLVKKAARILSVSEAVPLLRGVRGVFQAESKITIQPQPPTL
ncbi:hypothetical protein Q765_10690 [Flavobacterium rivuli WB 3.3-2 = DSM 21788]|uniref:Uncharacterized protein n=1 Tax=Flavobacterium rivuli WB 3.3-2 = DSM 21788 TaxID=1121895 RepID=A0A0A2M411_9FLAO|nr:hypothetical protein Q765_10690 [Flavobacterium rivuli WB 3.3-2 = DSM 21788]